MMIFKKSNTVLGLDIGTHAIKFVEMSHSGKGTVITNCGYVNIPQDSPEYDPSNELKNCLSAHNVRAKKAVIAVPACSTEQITLDIKFLEENIPPDISNKELSARVWLKAGDEISGLYDSVIDCQFLRRTTLNGSPGTQILFVAVNREYIEERIALVKKIGLIPVAIDVDLFAIERLTAYTGQLPGDSYATIIDIGNSKASIGFYQNGILNHIYDVDEGGGDITKEIADNLDIELNEAEAHKLKETLFEKVGAAIDEFYRRDEAANLLETEPSDSEQDAAPEANGGEATSQNLLDSYLTIGLDDDILNADSPFEEDSEEEEMVWQPKPEIANILGDSQRHGLYQSLHTCFRAYETDFSDAQLSKIILAGGTSQMKNLGDYFADKLEIPTEIIDYTVAISLQEGANLDALKMNEPTYAVAAGLALKLAPRLQTRLAPSETEEPNEEIEGGEEE